MFSEKHCAVWPCDNQRYQCELLLFFFFLSFGSYQCTWFSVLPLAFVFFFPSRTISGDLKRMKETTVTKLECMETIPPPHRGQGTDPTTLYLPLSSSLPSGYTSTLHPHCYPGLLYPSSLAKGKMATSPGAMMCSLRGSVVFGEIARLGGYLKVNTIYLHLLSCGLTKGHHC